MEDIGPDERLTAQAAGAPAATGISAAEPEPHEDSASELNRKLTNPVSSSVDWVDLSLATRSMELMASEVLPRVNRALRE